MAGNEPFNAAADGGLPAEIALLLTRLVEKGTHRFLPRPDVDGTMTKPVRTATLNFSIELRPDVMHARIAVGEEGSHAAATKPRRRAKNLEGWSAEAPHEVTFVFPKGNESQFFLITQTTHRRDPHTRLLAMLREESKILRAERQDEDVARREAARAAGIKAPKKKDFKRLVFQDRQASDNDYLDELLAGADAATVVFKSKQLDSVGNTSFVSRVLQIKLRNQNIIDVGRQASRSWVRRWRAGNKPTPHEAMSEVADLLEERDLLLDGEQAQYETAAINVRGKSADASTTISVDTLRDAFTYPLSDIPPHPYTYFERVSDRLTKIARQEGIEIEPIDPHEASLCLTDSTPAGS